jgi:hypothetical protein
VFELNEKVDKVTGKVSVSGCHYNDAKMMHILTDSNLTILITKEIGPYVTEGYIIGATTHIQSYVFKTFFTSALSREEIIDRVIEAINHVTSLDDTQPKNWVITGQTNDAIRISIVADKITGEVISFFPEASDLRPKVQSSKETAVPSNRKCSSIKAGPRRMHNRSNDVVVILVLVYCSS